MDNEKIMEMEEKFQQSRAIENQVQFIEQQTSELRDLQKTLQDIRNSEGKEVLAPIGKGTFLKTDVKEKNLFVDVGAGIIVRKSSEDAEKIIDEQLNKIREIQFQLNSRLEGLNTEIENFVKEMENQN